MKLFALKCLTVSLNTIEICMIRGRLSPAGTAGLEAQVAFQHSPAITPSLMLRVKAISLLGPHSVLGLVLPSHRLYTHRILIRQEIATDTWGLVVGFLY